MPVFISKALSDDKMRTISPSFIPMAYMKKLFYGPKIRGVLQTHFFTAAFVNCGKDNHCRFNIAHTNVATVVNWIWSVLDCFELVLIDKIVLHQECGNPIEKDNSTIGTAAGYLKDNEHQYVLTAKHIISSEAVYSIGEIKIEKGIKFSFEDAAIYKLESNTTKLINTLKNERKLILNENTDVDRENSFFKYGASTKKIVKMEKIYSGFMGLVYFGGVDNPMTYVGDLVIADGESSDSTGGDSGGPWFTESSALIGVHRGFIEYIKDNERIQPKEGRKFFAATSIFPLIAEIESAELKWL